MPGQLVQVLAIKGDAFTYNPAPPSAKFAPRTATIEVRFSGFSTQARTAFQYAVDIWETQLTSPVPIVVDANFTPLEPGTLGSAGATVFYRNFSGATSSNTWYPIALANKLHGSDLDQSIADITVSMASNRSDWYYGTDAHPPSGRYDFVSVVMHELGHGLGFLGSLNVQSGLGIWGTYPYIWDLFAENGSGVSLIDTVSFPNGSAALAAQLQGGSVYFDGANTRAANGHAPARLYAPSTWVQGSSYSHLDETTYPPGNENSLMTPGLNSAEGKHDPGLITRGMFTDMGWTTSAPCPYWLSPSGANFTATAGAGSVTVTADSGCSWAATSNRSWITITSGSSGTGDGTVAYSVAANDGTSSRMGSITIGELTFWVSQVDRCGNSISPTSQSVVAAGTTASVTVTSTGGCDWTATSNVGWITITSGSSGTGNGTVAYSVAANNGTTPRTGTMTIAGQTFTVAQAGEVTTCGYSISPASQSVVAAGTTASVAVTARSDCSWTATSIQGWVTITSGSTGTGNGTVAYSVTANTDVNSRKGIITIAGLTFWVTQAGITCSYSISPTSQLLGSSGGSGSVSVTVNNSCPWWAASTANWITITSGSSGSGNGTVAYSVAQNTSVSSRTGTVTIASQTFTVTQSGFSTTPPTLTVSKAGLGSGTVTSAPTGIDCGSTCSASFTNGTSVALTATAAVESIFVGWSGGGCSGVGGCAINLTSDATVTATFLATGIIDRASHGIDLNGDGRGDVFRYDAVTGTWRMDIENGILVPWTSSTWSPAWVVKTGDFNGDAVTDFFLYNVTSGQWFKAINTGSGDFTYFTSMWSPGWSVGIVDLNGDGKSDVFLYNPTTGQWFRCTSTDSGTTDFAYAGGTWSPDWQVYPVDLNADGRTDFFLYNPATGQSFRATNDGLNGFTYVTEFWSPSWEITSGDFNNDGLTDLFGYNSSTGQWLAVMNTGSGFSYTTETWSTAWKVYRGDLNGDGRTDIFLYNPTSGMWFECFSTGTGRFSYASGSWSPDWQVFVTEFNLDDRADILVYNPTSGVYVQCFNVSNGVFAYASGNWGSGSTIVANQP